MDEQTGAQQDPAASASEGLGIVKDCPETGAKNTEVFQNMGEAPESRLRPRQMRLVAARMCNPDLRRAGRAGIGGAPERRRQPGAPDGLQRHADARPQDPQHRGHRAPSAHDGK